MGRSGSEEREDNVEESWRPVGSGGLNREIQQRARRAAREPRRCSEHRHWELPTRVRTGGGDPDARREFSTAEP